SFEKLNEVSYICGQLESTKSGKLHAQMFIQKPARWERGQFTQEIVGPFEFGEFRVIDKKKSNDLNKLRVDEHNAIIEENNMLLDNATLLEVFRYNKDR
ncbi:11737_t:CDS:2, partial [Cetraspora pellucida]